MNTDTIKNLVTEIDNQLAIITGQYEKLNNAKSALLLLLDEPVKENDPEPIKLWNQPGSGSFSVKSGDLISMIKQDGPISSAQIIVQMGAETKADKQKVYAQLTILKKSGSIHQDDKSRLYRVR